MASASGLSVSALLLQTAFSNDLMDPYLIGSLSGAMVAAASVVLTMGLTTLDSPIIFVSTFLGASVPGLLVALYALKGGKSGSLIFGISLMLALQGMASILSYLASAASDLPFLPMLLGTTQYVTVGVLKTTTLMIIPAFIVSALLYRKLALLEYPRGFPESFGSDEGKLVAASVGVASLSAGAVVACCGVLPFLGLMGALIGRRLAPIGSLRALLISFLASASIMCLTDLMANSVETPYGFLPVGAFLSLIGGLALALLTVRGRAGYG